MNVRHLSAAAALFICQDPAHIGRAFAAEARTEATYAVRTWGTDEGLPGSSVLAVVQTRDGYLWLGTLYGLARFDGIRFTVFDESNTPGLNDSRITSLFEDNSGNLWIGTESAGTVLMRNGQIVSFPELAIGGRERKLLAACEDAEGGVWLYHANGDLWRYHKQLLTPLLFAPSDGGQPRSIIKETDGPVWLATNRRQYAVETVGVGSAMLRVNHEEPVNQLDLLVPGRRGGYWRLSNFRIQHCNTRGVERDLGPYPWFSSGRFIAAACEDHDGDLIVGTVGAGLFRIRRDGTVSTNTGLSYEWILSLEVDREGSLWVGTDGRGLSRIKRQHFRTVEGTGSWAVQSVCADRTGGLWIGSNLDGVGYCEPGTASVSRRFGATEGLAGLAQNVRSVFVDRSERVWVGTRGAGVFQFRDGRFYHVIPNGTVQAIHQDRAGRLWFGTEAGLFSWNEREWKSYRATEGLSSDIVTALADDAQGNLWIGTRRGGLNRLRDGRFTVFRKSDGLPSDDVSSLLMDNEGALWIGTFGGGLGRFQNGAFARFSSRDGLISNSLGYLAEDGESLWIGSNRGVLRFSKKGLHDFADGKTDSLGGRAYGTADGLPTVECSTGSQPGVWRGVDGKLWLPTIKGLAFVDPRDLRPNTNPPPVTIELALIDDVPAKATRGESGDRALVLRPGEERLEIQYSSLNLGAPERARFKYRLEGYEKNWTEVGGDTRAAHYSKLTPWFFPGRYAFHVIACNEDGVWNETGSTLAVIVQPPFWRTWWFIGATALAVFALVAGIVHYLSTQKLQRQVGVLKQQEALERERARIARDIHDQVGASLTQVALLGELVETDKNLPGEVSTHAQQISQTARETTRSLDEIVWTVNPSNDTLEGLINYVCKHAQEYLAVAGLRYRLEVPEPLPALAISPEVRHNVFLAAKEAVTNIVRHAKATSAWIRLRLPAGSFVLEIEDNGRGIADPNAPSVRNGLRNMRKRMEDIGGEFTIGRGGEGGALVRLTVPLSRHKVPA